MRKRGGKLKDDLDDEHIKSNVIILFKAMTIYAIVVTVYYFLCDSFWHKGQVVGTLLINTVCAGMGGISEGSFEGSSCCLGMKECCQAV